MAALSQDLNRHLEEGELEEYVMADLRQGETGGRQVHVLDCEHCRQRLAETDAYVTSMRRAAAQLRNRQRLTAKSR